MPDLLDKTRAGIAGRLKELKPTVDEYERLLAAASALELHGSATPTPRRRGPGRPRGTSGHGRKASAGTSVKGTASPKGRAGRRKRSGTRAAEALSFVQAQPGITISELAAKMGIKQNYLYRVLPGLQQEKKVSRQGRGWHAAK